MLRILLTFALQFVFCVTANAQMSERVMQNLIDGACASEKYGGGPEAYERCVSRQLLSYSLSVAIPDMSGYDRTIRTMIDSACSSEKYGGGPAAYARCATNQLSSYSQSVPIPDMSGYDRTIRTMIDSACSSEKYGGGPTAYARCATNQLSSIAFPSHAVNEERSFQILGIESEPFVSKPIVLGGEFPSENEATAAHLPKVNVDLYAPTAVLPRSLSEKRDDKIYQAQIMLELLGYKPGPLDGKRGPRTKTAIQKFQQSEGMKVDGVASLTLLERLRVSLQARSLEQSSIVTLPSRQVFPDAVSTQPAPAKNRFQSNVKNVQLALQAFGYYSGPIDGVVNPKTGEAITAMQTDYGLRVTGTVTPQIFTALGIDVKTAE